MPAFAHFILTRFNLGMRGNVAEVEAWHQHRFSLFERFCLPSVKGQTNTSFAWLLFCDKMTPRILLPRLESYQNPPHIQIHFIEGFDLPAILRILRSQIPENAEYLITTTLDNDDALGTHHVAEIQSGFRISGPWRNAW